MTRETDKEVKILGAKTEHPAQLPPKEVKIIGSNPIKPVEILEPRPKK